MVELGKWNTLEVVKHVDFGLYLDGGEDGEILMPLKYVPEGVSDGDDVDVFVYLDSEERMVATTETPSATVGEIGHMKVTHVNDYGAFADWGITKELFIPFREQSHKLVAGEDVLVYVYLDPLTFRLVGTTKIKKHIGVIPENLREGDQLRVTIWRETPNGYVALLDGGGSGLLYRNDVFRDMHVGKELSAYVDKVREDGKIDLTLRKRGYSEVEDFSTTLYTYIIAQGGRIPLHDKSAPVDIKLSLNVSKKVFKKAVGKLFKESKIVLEKDGIRLK